jgi:LysM repeat protein
MSKKIGLIILVLLTMLLSACERKASVAPTATPKKDFPQALATDGMNVVEVSGTQTAMAKSGTPVIVETATPAPAAADATTTPLAGVEQTPVTMATFTPVGQEPAKATDTPLPSPTPAVVSAQPTVSTVKPGTYTLKTGEFPYCIARRFNVNPDELLAANGLSKSQSYYAPGTVLKIPSGGNVFPAQRYIKTHPATYTVQSGDTIYSVACAFGDVDPLGIASANGLSAPYTLTVGAQISIP